MINWFIKSHIVFFLVSSPFRKQIKIKKVELLKIKKKYRRLKTSNSYEQHRGYSTKHEQKSS